MEKLNFLKIHLPLSVKYELEKLQKHFDKLNEKVHNNEIKINNDLSIHKLTMSTKAAYGHGLIIGWVMI